MVSVLFFNSCLALCLLHYDLIKYLADVSVMDGDGIRSKSARSVVDVAYMTS